MKKSVVSVVVALSVLFLSSGILFAQSTGRNMKAPRADFNRMHNTGMRGMGVHRAEMMKKLNLTDQQKQKIEELRIAFQKKMVDLKADLQKSKLDLKELRVKGDFNRNDVIEAVEKINKSKNAVSVAFANHMMDVYEVLTPEQQKTWNKIRPFMRNRMSRGKNMMQHKWMMR